MAEDSPPGKPIDWETAQIHAEQLVNKFRTLELLADVMVTANQARGWLGGAQAEIDKKKAELETLHQQRTAAVKAVTDAKRIQAAAEAGAKQAADEAQAAENQASAKVRSAQNAQAGRVKELEDALEGRRRVLESDYAQRTAELDAQIGAKQAELSEITGTIEALRAGLPSARSK